MKRKAKNIPAKLTIGRDFDSEFPTADEIDWLRQWWPSATGQGNYLVECIGGDCPIRIWERLSDSDGNHIDALYTLVWEGKE